LRRFFVVGFLVVLSCTFADEMAERAGIFLGKSMGNLRGAV
jgi:hypothetical protein